jgi:hypothetical protein
MDTEQAKRQMDEEHAEGMKPCPPTRTGGSAGHRNQFGHTRMVGEDPLVRHALVNPSRIIKPSPHEPVAKVKPITRQHP